MSDRISKTTLLCEDDLQASLVRAYWNHCRYKNTSAPLQIKNASRIVHGGNIGWVLEHFEEEFRACQQRHNAKANTLLIVVADADTSVVANREHELQNRTKYTDDDPLVVLIPKRHIETWICAAIGMQVTEEEDCKRHKLGQPEVRQAAKQIHDWAHNGPLADSLCVDSLRLALPRWKKIG